MVKFWETLLEEEGHIKTPETLYVWSMCMMVLWRLLFWIHVGEHSDWIIEFGLKTAEIYFFGMSAQLVSVQNETRLWLAGIN